MKKILFAIMTIAVMLGFCGCTSTNASCAGTNSSSFNDETYVWENWSFTTNQIERVY